jgi:enoyl-CoA hydratase/carnithine racemase
VNYRNNLALVEKKEQGVALVTLNNPPLNLITLAVSAELTDTMQRLDRDEDVRVVVLTGSPGKAFCAGADIKEFPAVADDVIGKKLKKENDAMNSVEFLSKPVIAAMEGVVMGGGCELAMACDIRILSETGKMSLPEINLGVFPGSGGLFRLPKLVGPSKALEMMYTGDVLSAREAKEAGLVNRLAPEGQALKAALELAAQIAVKPAQSLKLIKQGVREIGYLSTAECFEKNLDFSETIFKTPDCAEGVDAFLNKRKPRFQ